jgi:hypothetical protein
MELKMAGANLSDVARKVIFQVAAVGPLGVYPKFGTTAPPLFVPNIRRNPPLIGWQAQNLVLRARI